ncbi:AlbA family DNA-binding domain-containing protein [Streptobacillus canis]|uniref:AlbA family DNA-binding domain-containing protein n=1 Tax=Streptobacillus canis TaxID=2678686 RepID=UPI0012E24DFE
MSPFANTKGGKLLFGIADNDELIGLKNAKKDAENIGEIIKTKLYPIPRIELKIIDINSKNNNCTYNF